MAEAVKNSTYYIIFVALAILTVVTVLAAQVDIGHVGNIVVGALIAAVKATLVALFFMHLKYETDRWVFLAALFPLLLFAILCFALIPDIGFPLRG